MESIDTRGKLCQRTLDLATATHNSSSVILVIIEQVPISQLLLIFLHHLSSFYHDKTPCSTLLVITWLQTEPAGTWLHYADNQQQFNQLINLTSLYISIKRNDGYIHTRRLF